MQWCHEDDRELVRQRRVPDSLLLPRSSAPSLFSLLSTDLLLHVLLYADKSVVTLFTSCHVLLTHSGLSRFILSKLPSTRTVKCQIMPHNMLYDDDSKSNALQPEVRQVCVAEHDYLRYLQTLDVNTLSIHDNDGYYNQDYDDIYSYSDTIGYPEDSDSDASSPHELVEEETTQKCGEDDTLSVLPLIEESSITDAWFGSLPSHPLTLVRYLCCIFCPISVLDDWVLSVENSVCVNLVFPAGTWRTPWKDKELHSRREHLPRDEKRLEEQALHRMLAAARAHPNHEVLLDIILRAAAFGCPALCRAACSLHLLPGPCSIPLQLIRNRHQQIGRVLMLLGVMARVQPLLVLGGQLMCGWWDYDVTFVRHNLDVRSWVLKNRNSLHHLVYYYLIASTDEADELEANTHAASAEINELQVENSIEHEPMSTSKILLVELADYIGELLRYHKFTKVKTKHRMAPALGLIKHILERLVSIRYPIRHRAHTPPSSSLMHSSFQSEDQAYSIIRQQARAEQIVNVVVSTLNEVLKQHTPHEYDGDAKTEPTWLHLSLKDLEDVWLQFKPPMLFIHAITQHWPDALYLAYPWSSKISRELLVLDFWFPSTFDLDHTITTARFNDFISSVVAESVQMQMEIAKLPSGDVVPLPLTTCQYNKSFGVWLVCVPTALGHEERFCRDYVCKAAWDYDSRFSTSKYPHSERFNLQERCWDLCTSAHQHIPQHIPNTFDRSCPFSAHQVHTMILDAVTTSIGHHLPLAQLFRMYHHIVRRNNSIPLHTIPILLRQLVPLTAAHGKLEQMKWLIAELGVGPITGSHQQNIDNTISLVPDHVLLCLQQAMTTALHSQQVSIIHFLMDNFKCLRWDQQSRREACIKAARSACPSMLHLCLNGCTWWDGETDTLTTTAGAPSFSFRVYMLMRCTILVDSLSHCDDARLQLCARILLFNSLHECPPCTCCAHDSRDSEWQDLPVLSIFDHPVQHVWDARSRSPHTSQNPCSRFGRQSPESSKLVATCSCRQFYSFLSARQALAHLCHSLNEFLPELDLYDRVCAFNQFVLHIWTKHFQCLPHGY